jgi:uncharacterized protein
LKVAIALAVLVAGSLFANYYLYSQLEDRDRAVAALQAQVADLQTRLAAKPAAEKPVEVQKPHPSPQVAPVGGSTSQSIAAVAVKQVVVSDGFFQRTQYQGLVMNITVDIREGKGLVLVNTEIPAGVDFQTSARTAVKVAQESLPGADLSKRDVIFSITSNDKQSDLQAVDGPSAGAAMTLLLISELQSKNINGSILITGTIEPDGTVGPVGGVPEKALAAGQYGAKVLLVPKGEAVYPEQTCQDHQQGPIIYHSCTEEQKPLSPATEAKYGMKVIEVENISQALQHFQS